MKTISLEVDEQIYPHIVNFLRLLPEDSCHVLEDEDSALSPQEHSAIQVIQAHLQAGDESEFEDWDDIKDTL